MQSNGSVLQRIAKVLLQRVNPLVPKMVYKYKPTALVVGAKIYYPSEHKKRGFSDY